MVHSDTFTIGSHERGRSLGRVLDLPGCLEIAYALREGPRRYKDIKGQLRMNDQKVSRRLRAMATLDLVEKQPTATPRVRVWTLTSTGERLMKFIAPFESRVTRRQVAAAVTAK